ncbi:uncharacterized protein AMSG_02672 [Thecamonas trahens ATCC 50062]|uniref:Uncharacterized protein n=1 Tax=Thecamonas trahens ATCC 50062 TaxID=461836 RepID=A0A0L0D1Z1_THETB|nr:hypothetical protein AMSG_02672 [Thecamonas trahens ATCC 50062]KNC46221.1 hypothetical protein AMSG_02672 [Thecamonas trahens ATCC 50062]|eukprot:XP_013760518.1 hypothetical protein AMSG_02672 [Thecamonas trahens ATCC 50062]
MFEKSVPYAMLAFAAPVVLAIARHPSMFVRRYARRHRLLGGALLMHLSLGWMMLLAPMPQVKEEMIKEYSTAYNVVLGLLGCATTAAAAADFAAAHDEARIANAASGTLSERAVVTTAEMVEHVFYQLLNLAQAVFIALVPAWPLSARLIALAAITCLWLLRPLFPVNSFSDNYQTDAAAAAESPLVPVMYRVKKAQYLLYKHALLHGLNVSLAVNGLALASHRAFPYYWLALNTAYVLEFFLQTLVRKRYMAQSVHLVINGLLMAVSTGAALAVLAHVDLAAATLSLVLNFAHRGHEVLNTGLVTLVALARL